RGGGVKFAVANHRGRVARTACTDAFGVVLLAGRGIQAGCDAAVLDHVDQAIVVDRSRALGHAAPMLPDDLGIAVLIAGTNGNQRVLVFEAVEPIDDLLPLLLGQFAIAVLVEPAKEAAQRVVALPVGVDARQDAVILFGLLLIQ